MIVRLTFQKFFIIIYIDKIRKEKNKVFKISLNELMALTLVLDEITVADLIEAAAETFSHNVDVRSKEKESTCIKALETFLA